MGRVLVLLVVYGDLRSEVLRWTFWWLCFEVKL